LAHGLALEIIDDMFAQIARANAVIDRVVKPITAVAQHFGDKGFAKA